MEVQLLCEGAKLSKGSFTELVDEVWSVALTEYNIMTGFNFNGIYLVNCSKYSDLDLITRKKKELEEKSNAENEKETQKQKNVDIERNLNL